MTIDTWSHRIKDFLSDSWLFAELLDLMLVLISELDNLLITKSSDIVGLDDGCENWESVLHIGSIIEFVNENTCDFNFISWSSSVDKVIEDKDLLLSWNTTWRNRSGSFLDCPFLVVSVDRFVILKMVRTLRLADDALSQVLLLLFDVVVEEWALEILALLASEVHFFELWENSCSLCNHSSDLDKSIQVNLSQISEFILNWKVLNSHEDLIMDPMIVWINLNDYIKSNLVDNIKHELWLLSQPNCQSWVFSTQVIEDDFQALFVILAHIMDLCLIKIDSLISFEMSDELLELSLDIPDNLLLFKPDK
jgi:hypothetical protein